MTGDSFHPIRAYRDRDGLTLEAMAAKLGLSGAGLSRIEAGAWPGSIPGFLARLAAATNGAVTAGDLHPIRLYRKREGLTLEAMGAKLGLSGASLSRIESGKQWPGSNLDFLGRLAAATAGAVTANDLVAARAAQ